MWMVTQDSVLAMVTPPRFGCETFFQNGAC